MKLQQRLLAAFAVTGMMVGLAACGSSTAKYASYTPCSYTTNKPAIDQTAPALEGFQKVTENGYLGLYVQKDTAVVAVYDKASGQFYKTNPDMQGKSSDNNAKAQFTLSYTDVNGKITSMNSYTESVKRNQVTAVPQKDGLRMDYVVGDNARGVNDLPKKISDARFRALIFDKVDTSAQRVLKRRYSLNQDTNIWTLRKVSNTQYIAELLEIFDKAGYTPQELAKDNQEHNIPASAVARRVYRVSLQYTLEADSVKVSVPLNKITYPEDYPPVRLDLLEYFEAGTGAEQGYMLLPDGSGALMDFKTVPAATKGYSAPVYGADLSLPVNEQSSITQNVTMPVYGIKKSTHALFGVIENGDALATIEANNAGAKNNYNQIYSSFTVVKTQSVTMGGSVQSSYNKFQSKPYDGDAVVRFFFLAGDHADYSGMANTYRQYLVEKHDLGKLDKKESIPLYVETVGAIDYTQSFLGIRYSGKEALTTFEDNMTILKELQQEGIRNVRLRLLGWFGGGMDQNLAKDVKPENVLGGKKAFESLLLYAEQNKIKIFPDVQFLTFEKEASMLKKNDYSAKTLDGKESHKNYFNPATMGINQQLEVPYRIITSVSALPGLVDRFTSRYKGWGCNQLSLGDVGGAVYADYNSNREVDRQTAFWQQIEEIQKMQKSFNGIMMNSANIPMAMFAKDIINVPSGNSGYVFESCRIPFYQMVLHGYKDYSAGAINFAVDSRQEFLRAVESGSSIGFKWFYRNAGAIKTSDYAHLYAANYALWKQDAVKQYQELNEVLIPLQQQAIVHHAVLSDGVTRTTYEDGTKVYVNYTDKTVTAEETTVNAADFTVVKGGDPS